ncbi:hypothetical protein [Aeromonas sobria]|uniref:hypothetical protein n=1 Tax=Aeromonas sobria TaxID=646 RepID=UPI000C6E1437|nr:hypothetical protein [Aeromonas sobria]PKQ78089.1 hypothetical protein CJF47_07355 [Aeromonas sobria]
MSKEFSLSNIQALSDLKAKVKTIEINGWEFYCRELSAQDNYKLQAALFKLGTVAQANDAGAYSKALDELHKIAVLGGVVDSKGQKLFQNEKQYKTFCESCSSEVVEQLAAAVSSAADTKATQEEASTARQEEMDAKKE